MKILEDLKKFALRGNLFDMAIGFTVGAAFTTIAKSLVNDIIMPPIGLITGGTDFADKFWVLKEGAEKAAPYATLAEAQASGAVTMNYGVFLNNLIAFILVTLVMFLIIRLVNKAEDALDDVFDEPSPEPGEPTEKKCPFCRTVIPAKAIRCPHCTSELEPPPPLSTEPRSSVT